MFFVVFSLNFHDNVIMKTTDQVKENADFWIRFKDLCKSKKVTQVELCEKTGIDKGKLQGQITRNIAPSVFDAQKIADYLNISVEYLTTGTEKNAYKAKYDNLKSKIEKALSEEEA